MTETLAATASAVESYEDESMEPACPSQAEVLKELEQTAPGAPFLALGQTVFWDEPMKAGVALRSRELGHQRRFVAGIHDTDYFAKLHQPGATVGFRALPHNDTTTKALWSAAGEFSALFGSETVVTRERLLQAGSRVAEIQAQRPGYLESITEAPGWRGVVSLSAEARITAEKQLDPLFPVLFETLDWALEESLQHIAGPHRGQSDLRASDLRSAVCDASTEAEGGTLAEYYRLLLPKVQRLVAGAEPSIDTTATTELLRFNPSTANLPRFKLLGAFIDPETRESACKAYDQAVAGSEIYVLEKFGAGALPFDVFIPGIGRGTLRLGSRGGVVMAPKPVGFSFKKPPRSPAELAGILEQRFGPDCVLIGKAVTLIGMLASEYVFVFHQGASSYVPRSRKFHQLLEESGLEVQVNPILRVKLDSWSALDSCCAWFQLPEPLRRPFGVDELSGCSLSARWRVVAAEQRQVLEELANLRRPLDLVRYLDLKVGGQWNCLAAQYDGVHDAIADLQRRLLEISAQKQAVLERQRSARQRRSEAEKASGDHWRNRIFEKSPTADELAERERKQQAVRAAIEDISGCRAEWATLQAQQDAIVGSEEAKKGRVLRQNIAFEAELTRAKLVREAVIASEGMERAGQRPAAWWFPLVCPDGAWFRETSRRAQYSLEALL